MPKPKTVPNKLLIGFSDEQLAELDKWRRKQEDLPSRSEGVRRLVDGGLVEALDPRETWKGFLRLSLVTCPVALIPATDAEATHHAEVTRKGLDSSAPESAHTIEIDEFVPRSEIDPLYILRPYYLVPDGKVGHDAFAVIRETIRATSRVAISRVMLNNRERVIVLDAHNEGMVGMLLRYSHEVHDRAQYFDNIQNVRVTKDMLDLSKHIVERMSGHFEPDKYENHYKSAPLVEEQSNRPIASEDSNVINLMDALKILAKEKPKERRAATKK
jgi:DNA end-binding protein Ku